MSHAPPASPVLGAVLCTRDRADLLRGTLESLCQQTLPTDAFEVVVVDDGSTDGTREVVRAFEPRLPLRYTRQRAAGLAAARNHGVFFSRGEILLFLDDDDLADPELLREHVEAHRRHPEPRHAVLGHTRLHPSIADDPLMQFVTEVGCFLFSYPRIPPGKLLDFSYFWGGRSSCKRSFLLAHGVFNPTFRFGAEDIELGYRLARHGLEVVYAPRAVSTMVRRIGVDDFCRRLHRQGQSNWVFSRLHADPMVQQWTEVDEAGRAWSEVAPAYETILRSARELDRLFRMRQEARLPQDRLDLALLHRSYWAAFRASKAKGIVDKAKELGVDLVARAAAAKRCAPGQAAPAQPSDALSRLLAAMPGIHAGGKITWGLSEDALRFIDGEVGQGARTLETGAGASTVLFALKGSDHTCITPAADEVERLKAFCAEHGVATERVSFVVEKSQHALPRLDEAGQLDLVLIDGGHGFPVPFLDWFFTAPRVKVGGIVVVDDTQLWTGEVLRDFLLAEPEWRLEARFARGAAFRKVSERIEKEWNEQPFVFERSESPGRPRRRTA